MVGLVAWLSPSLRAQCGAPPAVVESFTHPNGTLVDTIDDLRATTAPVPAVIVNNEARLAVRSNRLYSHLQPWCDWCTWHPISWPLDMVYRRYTRIEMDLRPSFVTTNATSADSRFSVCFATGDDPAVPITTATLDKIMVSVDLLCDQLTGGAVDVEFGVRIREPGSTGQVIALDLPDVIKQMLPDFTGTSRHYAFEFGWDWYEMPNRHRVVAGQYTYDGLPWLFVRVLYEDNGIWRNPMVEASNPANGFLENFDGTGGWIRFGTDDRLGGQDVGRAGPKIGGDRDDWLAAADYPECDAVCPYVLVERLGTADVDWFIDDFAGKAKLPDPVTLFVNTVGYETAGAQWAMIRPNREVFRDQVNMDAMNVQSIELLDANDVVLRELGDPVDWITVSAAERCFQELDVTQTELDWPWDTATDTDNDTDFHPIYWRRVEWKPITDTLSGCKLRMVVEAPATSSEPATTFTIESAPFGFDEEIWWKALWPRLALDNELARRGPNFSFEGGWSDAGNDYAEARSHGLFLSGLSHVVRTRRAELPTSEVSGLVDAIKFGGDWVLRLVEDNTSSDFDAGRRREEHEELDQGCGESHASHYLLLGDGKSEDDLGHIWGEHRSRPRGDPSTIPPGQDYNDEANRGDFILFTAYGLADAALAMQAFDGNLASSYVSQCESTRDYLWWLEDNFNCSADEELHFEFRAQAAFDLALHDLGASLGATEDKWNHPDPDPGSGPGSNLALARAKLIADLTEHPVLTSTSSWAGCGHGMTAPAHPPWLGLLRMEELGQSDPAPPLPSWHTALAAVARLWYRDTVAVNNALRLSRFWNSTATHRAFKGIVQRPNDKVAYEAHSIARLAMALDLDDASERSSFEELRELAVGTMDWLFGIHYGVRGRYVLPPTDREWECGAFLPTIGSRTVVQNTIAIHYWDQPSVLAGPGGELDLTSNLGPTLPPWTFTPQNYGNTETFIRRDGSMLMAAECVSHLFHRRLVFEAEAADASFTANPNGVQVQSNDVPDTVNVPPSYAYPAALWNGGESVIATYAADWLRFHIRTGTATEAPDPEPTDPTRAYRVLLRSGNPSLNEKTLRVEVFVTGATTPFWTGTAVVPPTGHAHDCVVVTALHAVSTTDLVLDRTVDYDVKVTFVNGDASLDCITLKSRGK